MSRPPQPSQMRLDRLLANMGYGSRKEVQGLAKAGRIILDGAPITNPDQRIPVTPDLAQRMTVQGRPLDPPPGLALMLHKPLGVTCSHKEAGALVYELLPDRSKLIVPNSDLISKVVRNVTHSGAVGRLKIVLKTEDSADPAAVRDLILARLKQHPAILKDPAADVFLSNVVDGALEFTAFAYLSSPRLIYKTRSDLLFQIVPDLKAKGVALANAAPVVNVGLAERAIEPAPEKG